MSTAEIKNQLHQMIDALDDKKSSAALEFVQHIQSHNSNQFDNLTADEIAAITQARMEIKNGKFFTLEEFNLMRKQWRTK
jgi:hypothetical protein